MSPASVTSTVPEDQPNPLAGAKAPMSVDETKSHSDQAHSSHMPFGGDKRDGVKPEKFTGDAGNDGGALGPNEGMPRSKRDDDGGGDMAESKKAKRADSAAIDPGVGQPRKKK